MGMVYREIKQAFIDMHKMFSLLDLQRDVVDRTDAVELDCRNTNIEFRDVLNVNIYLNKNKTFRLLYDKKFGLKERNLAEQFKF